MSLTLETPFEAALIPEEFKATEYFAPVKTVGDLVKSYGNAQKLIGQKAEAVSAPKDDAPPEAWNAYYEKLGRPKTPEEYGIKPDDKAPEPEKKMLAAMTKVFHAQGLSPRQVKGIINNYGPLAQAIQKEAGDSTSADFDKRMTEVFGADKDKKFEAAKKILNEFAPAKVRDDIENLDNKSLTILAAVVDALGAKFLGEGRLNTGSTGGSGSADTMDSLNAAVRAVMVKPGFDDFTHGDYKKLRAELESLKERMRKLPTKAA